MGTLRALEQWQVDDIVKQKGKKSAVQLGQQYGVHYRTIENYWKKYLKHETKEETKKHTIRIISTTAGKVRNYIVDKIDCGKLWTELYLNGEEIAKIWNNNIFAIEPVKEG